MTIPWEPWGEAAFARAQREGKPVLLHIGATWCHWCHVMDEGSYTWPGVAALMRDRFVPVRVDTDERPDINERYNQGGWPTFAVLDAEGEVLMGRTYVPGPELFALLSGLANSDARWTVAAARSMVSVAAPVAVEAVWEEVRKGFDRYHGGFGDFEKFPHLPVCNWILDRKLRGVDDAGMLAQTLAGMATRGMYDHEEGGFFRYTTQDDWTVPHYEKLLEDNAGLIDLYLRDVVVSGDARWHTAVGGALAWALSTLTDGDTPGFWGSQDADEAYYARSRVLRDRPPPVDRTVYAGWNGRMVAALVRAWAVWDRPGLLGIALQVGRRLLAERVDTYGKVARTSTMAGLLEDQVSVADGFLSLWTATGDDRWREGAQRCLEWATSNLAAPEGGLYDRVPEPIGRLRLPRRPLFANAAFATTAVKFGALIGDAKWVPAASAAADAALAEADGWGFMGAAAAAARERVDRVPTVAKVCQSPDLLRALLGDPHPDRLALLVGDGVPEGRALVCSLTACSRPVATLEEAQRAAEALRPR